MSASLEAAMHDSKNNVKRENTMMKRYKRLLIKVSAIVNKIRMTEDPHVPGAVLIRPEPKPTAIKWKILLKFGNLFFSMVPAFVS